MIHRCVNSCGYAARSELTVLQRVSIREKCCCPTFILAGSGADFAVLGSVWTDKFVVQRLTDIMYFGQARPSDDQKLYRLATIFTALEECKEMLDSYYDDIYKRLNSIPALIPQKPHPRFFPYPSQFIMHSTKVQLKFTYVDCLENDPASVTFLASTEHPNDPEMRHIVVKFVDRYGYEGHQLLADLGLAPQLLYCGLLNGQVDARDSESARGASTFIGGLYTGPWRMVVMEFVDGATMSVQRELWPPDVYQKIKDALGVLHSHGFAFGDLRPPNVMLKKDGNIMLIDFDWCGKEGVVRYPRALASTVKVGGAEDFDLVTMKHDEKMLDAYFS